MRRVSAPFRLAFFSLAVVVSAPALRADSIETTPARAPNQHAPYSYIPASTAGFQVPDVNTVFDKETYPEPEFLPPEVWEEAAEIPLDEGVQLTQYPFEDSAARDEDPAGHSATPRWNPVPYISRQLAMLPPERGLIRKETSGVLTVLPAPEEGLGVTDVDLRTVIYPGRLPFFQLTPRFGWHLLSESGLGLPPQVYDLGLDATVFLPLGERWSVMGMVSPNLFTDFENTGSDAFRMTGRVMAFYAPSPALKLAAGALYLGREDVAALPAAGLIWWPRDDIKAEVIFPKPKLAWRFSRDGDRERWAYLAGEFGGNSWAIRTPAGTDDMFTYRDYRLILGYEHIAGSQLRWLVEAGYVFGRVVEFRSLPGEFDQDATGLIRAGLVF